MSDAETVAPTEAPLDHDSVGDDLNPATIPPESDVASEPACNAEEACSLDPQQAVFPLDLQPAENDAQDAYPQHGDQDLLQMTYLQMTTNETVIHLTRMISDRAKFAHALNAHHYTRDTAGKFLLLLHEAFACSSFAFALRVDSAAASWAELILEEVRGVAREEQDDLRVYLEADNLPQIQANELRRSMSEDLPLLVFGPLSAFLATLLRGRLLVALTAVLAFAVPVIASLGILRRRDELLEGVEVRWSDGGVADLSAACAHAMEERWRFKRQRFELLSPTFSQVMACMPLEVSVAERGRFLESVDIAHQPFTVGDGADGHFYSKAARVQAWREASDLELSDALQTVFDNTFPFELEEYTAPGPTGKLAAIGKGRQGYTVDITTPTRSRPWQFAVSLAVVAPLLKGAFSAVVNSEQGCAQSSLRSHGEAWHEHDDLQIFAAGCTHLASRGDKVPSVAVKRPTSTTRAAVQDRSDNGNVIIFDEMGELGAKQDLAMDLKLKVSALSFRVIHDWKRMGGRRWSLIGVSLILGGLVLAYIVTVGLPKFGGL
ncbi:hypothetical protein AK812_SmicGene35745 [Symbiodinium microadriaticum]|uniref:Uncharacterized protein n=1 Tax=Symbiodinium microadriaticum TaxID=2951 RepID=A0A1Q9CKM3_SYMMI|nr:hypothetical protein AK812_SmicGene35745 [Symbiodinium microadriaticum]